MNDETYMNEWHAVYTIQLGELIDSGVFDWSRPELDWSAAAYDNDQYARICSYFIERFRYREISIVPFLEWAQMLKRKLVFELMPKYKYLYDNTDISPIASEDEYYKRRTIGSDYPETLLSENADYITTGHDEEYERIRIEEPVDHVMKFAELYHTTDELLLDELECMFISLYSSYVNGF